jgi:vacuolar-type H+-ATPase subunit F/Vma7
MTQLAKDALAESKRNDCELTNVRESGAGAWRIELMDVMLKREPFVVKVSADDSTSEQEIKDAIRRAVAEHFSTASY